MNIKILKAYMTIMDKFNMQPTWDEFIRYANAIRR